MKFRRLLAIGIINTAALAADEPQTITPEKVRESYRTFARVTKEPKSVSAEFAERCVGTPEMVQVAKETGPHAMRYLHYYLNEAAQHHRDARIGGAYPTGSVIVKEKIVKEKFFPGSAARDRDFNPVAGMIKRKSGSSPKTGDWEFFYFYPRTVPADGKPVVWEKAENLKSCVSCHSSAVDLVFGRFDEPYVTPKVGKTIRLQVAPTETLQLGPPK